MAKKRSAARIVDSATVPDSSTKGNSEGSQVRESRNGFLVDVRSFQRIQTADEAFQKAGLDPLVWEAFEVTGNHWEVACKIRNPDNQPDSVEIKTLWQVKIRARRRFNEAIEKSADRLAERVMQGGLKLPRVNYRKPKKDPSTLIVGLVDHHFGKLCWEPETGSNYDLDIAEHLWSHAIDAAIRRCSGHDIDEIVLPVGNDFGHIDTRAGTTESGTQQDVDGRYEKVASVQEMALIKAVERCRGEAPVRVIHVAGNHDRVTSWWLCRILHHAFRRTKHVVVDTSPKRVKYYQKGRCLWGFAHGDGPKRRSLRELMPVEAADDWARSTACREWITGHLHQQYSVAQVSTEEQAGMVFRILPSLCGTDSWHYANGYSLSAKATQNLLYSHEHGLTAIFHEPLSRLTA